MPEEKYFTVYDLIRCLSKFPAETEVIIAPFGAQKLDDMKNKLEVRTINAEGQNYCMIRTGEE